MLSICCKASWLCIKCHCGDLLGDEFIESVNEACTRSAFLLDVLCQVDNHKVKKKIIDILKNWCAASDLSERLPAPMPVVKQWVKVTSQNFPLSIWLFFLRLYFFLNIVIWYAIQMECKRVNQVDGKDSSLTLYCLLSSCTELSKRSIGIILEQV